MSAAAAGEPFGLEMGGRGLLFVPSVDLREGDSIAAKVAVGRLSGSSSRLTSWFVSLGMYPDMENKTLVTWAVITLFVGVSGMIVLSGVLDGPRREQSYRGGRIATSPVSSKMA